MAQHNDQDDRDCLSDFLIRFDVATLRRSAKGSITGNVFIELGTFIFPDRGWSDFVVIIFGWWLTALKRLVDGERRVELPFMDGPYAMRVTAFEPATWTLECVETVHAPNVVSSVSVDVARLIRETERVAAQVVTACETRGWQSSDVDTLRHLLSPPTSLRHH